jgi:hypothetical protein
MDMEAAAGMNSISFGRLSENKKELGALEIVCCCCFCSSCCTASC